MRKAAFVPQLCQSTEPGATVEIPPAARQPSLCNTAMLVAPQQPFTDDGACPWVEVQVVPASFACMYSSNFSM